VVARKKYRKTYNYMLTVQFLCVKLTVDTENLDKGARLMFKDGPGKRIKTYLDEHGIKQRYIAEKVGISLSTFNNKLNGKHGISADEIELVCGALNVSPELFIKPKLPEGV